MTIDCKYYSIRCKTQAIQNGSPKEGRWLWFRPNMSGKRKCWRISYHTSWRMITILDEVVTMIYIYINVINQQTNNRIWQSTHIANSSVQSVFWMTASRKKLKETSSWYSGTIITLHQALWGKTKAAETVYCELSKKSPNIKVFWRWQKASPNLNLQRSIS